MQRRQSANQQVDGDELFSAGGAQDVRRAVAWLDDRLRRAAQDGPFSEQVLLTPALAELLLKRNPDNRSMRPLKVANYVADMKAGAWELNGESVKVSADGLLNDGQHRCQAVVNAGCAVKTMIVFGVERKTRTTLDQGAVRSPGDYLGMEGIKDANNVAAAAALLWQYEHLQLVTYQDVKRPTKQQVKDTVAKYPQLMASVAFIPKKGALKAGGVSILAFCHYVFSLADTEAADHFVTKIVKGDGLQSRDPIYLARERIIGDKKLRLGEKVELIFRAWNAARLGKRPSKLQIMGGALPEVEG